MIFQKWIVCFIYVNFVGFMILKSTTKFLMVSTITPSLCAHPFFSMQSISFIMLCLSLSNLEIVLKDQ